MAVNKRVQEQVNILIDASGTDRFEAEKEIYWMILEVELRKQPINGWIPYEDPEDALTEAILDGAPKDEVKTILDDYIRFNSILKKVCGYDYMRDSIVEQAKEYVQ